MIPWHRLIGLTLIDLFAETPWEVVLEKDLSVKKQLLDIVIVRRRAGSFSGRLPDGLEDLADHNLITYKSLREALTDWTLKELTGHYVNYRKQVSPSLGELLPESSFQLFGLCTRYPETLAGQVRLERRQPGVYEVVRGTDQIRLLVLSEIAEVEHNAIWHLFSGVAERVRYGAEHYRQHTLDLSTVLQRLFESYQLEGLTMPYTWHDFRRECAKEYLSLLSPDERLQGLAPDERLQGLAPDERLRGLAQEEIEAYLERLRSQNGN